MEESFFAPENRKSVNAQIKAVLKRILNPLFACFSQKIASFFLFRA